ncbi:glycoside hydrolase family 28 protein [Enterococcus ratti]|uniref:Polygalacturonase n=1 Tax=Enterococcus ratti TaxID=150033 RepID=A0A1L8WQW5_9ENTE|nr:glycoside hydrolase family 28 protein [Enterococcus ratti]OJG83385.1 polygalacturonase [Enterococcus ratti]
MAYDILAFGASTKILNTEAIQQAIDLASKNGGGQVKIPAGEFLTGALFLKTNVELHLSAGAILKFSDNPKDYPVVMSRWEGVHREVYASCIYAQEQMNIAITGLGTLDGNGMKWWDTFRDAPENLAYPRPKLVSFHDCQRIIMKDIQLINSPSWTINPILCRNLTFDNLIILNPADSPNTDGIDPESCENVRISNCHIDVGDDCIAIKSGTEDLKEKIPCENITITITNCTMVHGHGGVVLGSEMSGDIRNIVLSNCVFQETDRGIRLKSRRGRGGIVEDIRINNIVMDQVMCPFILNLYYFYGPRGKEPYVWKKTVYPIDERTPQFRRIHFSDITARNVHAAAGFIYGLAEQFIQELTFDRIDISMAQKAKPGIPAMMTGLSVMSKQGFYLGFSKNIAFHQVSLENHEGPAFLLENTQQIEITKLRSTQSNDLNELIVEKKSAYETD